MQNVRTGPRDEDGTNEPPDLILCDLQLDFGGKPLLAIDHATIKGGDITCLLGPSGVGKTSLLRIIAGLLQPKHGQVQTSDGKALNGRIAYMPQSDCLMPWLSALDNVLLGKQLRGDVVTKDDRNQALDLLQQVGLADQAGKLPGTLSGGEKQRTALARVLFEDCAIVLMDEPFSALDAITRTQLQALTARVLKHRTVLMITHDPLEAIRLGDDIRILDGKPARMSASIRLDGVPPRPTNTKAVWQHHEQLLTQLMDRS